MNPRGGTELQMEMLYRHCPKTLLDKVSICTSVPGKIPLDPNKINILWQKNSYDQPNLQEFFSNKERHKEYDWYVFNSHWNYEKFRYFFGIPEDRSIVIKNGCTNFPKRKVYKKVATPQKKGKVSRKLPVAAGRRRRAERRRREGFFSTRQGSARPAPAIKKLFKKRLNSI